jgi:3-phenylpropionate/trans-cinnamate dioxygenase ferredoxin component
MTWMTIGTVESFEKTPRQFVDVGNTHIGVFKIGETFYAFESMCTHASYELDDAPVEGNEIICPLHGARFCLKTGAATAAPAYEDLLVFPVRIEQGRVEIKVVS